MAKLRSQRFQDDDDELRRLEVYKLLQVGTEQKLMYANTTRAIQNIREAYDLATRNPRIAGPLPFVAAYRLAHLLFRTARDCDSLQEVSELFRISMELPILGPLPCIYRLAALHRLEQVFVDNASIQSEIDATFSLALEHSDGVSIENPRRSRPALQTPLQDGVFNLLELATYSLGLPYTRLEGRGSHGISTIYEGVATGQASWVIVGRDPRIAQVRYPERLAFSELEERGKSFPEALVFRFGFAPLVAVWKRADQPGWTGANPSQLEYLALLLSGIVSTQEDFMRILLGSDAEPATLRQRKKRLKESLGDLLNRSQDEILQDQPGSELPTLGRNIRAFGAVDTRAFRG